jgi:hypothetical protein
MVRQNGHPPLEADRDVKARWWLSFCYHHGR